MRTRSLGAALAGVALLSLAPLSALADPPKRLRLRVGESAVVDVPGLERAATGAGRVAKLLPMPPGQLLVTGVQEGTTTVRTWGRDGSGVIAVTVVARRADPEASPSVVRAALEFVEIDRAIADALGVQWPEALHFRASANVTAGTAGNGIDFAAPFATSQGMLSFLAKRGWARVLSRPELLVRLGEEARFHSGGEVPVTNTVATQAGFSQAVEWKPYGLTVRIRPESLDGLRFFSSISVDLSELEPSPGPVPALNRRTLTTKMDSLDGETVLLSGLFREVVARDRQGLPGLSAIPVLQWFFSREVERRDRTELFFAMTLSQSTTLSRERDLRAWTERTGDQGR
jgi:Flp pilus assembly secretin CpaC